MFRENGSRISAVACALLWVPGGLLFGGGRSEKQPEINVYSHRHYAVDDEIYERFKERSGIQVNLIQASGSELIERIRAEGAASPADLLITADVGMLSRAQRLGLLQSVQSAKLEEAIPLNLRSDHWFGLTKRARIIVYHRDRVDPAQLSSYASLTDPQWRNRLLVRSSNNIYNISLLASLIVNEGAEQAEQWASGIVANFARNPQGNDRDQMKAIAAGIGDVAIVNTYYVGLLLNSADEAEREVGKLIGVVFPEQEGRGTHINISGAGVIATAPNRDNAVVLLEFLVSPEIQQLYASANYEYPVRSGVSPAGTVSSWGTFTEDSVSLKRIGDQSEAASRIFDVVGWR